MTWLSLFVVFSCRSWKSQKLIKEKKMIKKNDSAKSSWSLKLLYELILHVSFLLSKVFTHKFTYSNHGLVFMKKQSILMDSLQLYRIIFFWRRYILIVKSMISTEPNAYGFRPAYWAEITIFTPFGEVVMFDRRLKILLMPSELFWRWIRLS